MNVSGRAALVTGGASGIGAAVASALEAAVAKAGVIRLTTALDTGVVRVNAICPHTVATEKVLHALETQTLEEIAPPPATLLRIDEVVAGVLRLIEDDSLSGRVLLLTGGE